MAGRWSEPYAKIYGPERDRGCLHRHAHRSLQPSGGSEQAHDTSWHADAGWHKDHTDTVRRESSAEAEDWKHDVSESKWGQVARSLSRGGYGALVTVDADGMPRSRTVHYHPGFKTRKTSAEVTKEGVADFMSAWHRGNPPIYVSTNNASRKVAQIRNHPMVTLYVTVPSPRGYISVMGTAVVVDDNAERERV